MKTSANIVMILCCFILGLSCDKDNTADVFIEADLVNMWKIEIAPGWYSVWTFHADNTYDWYCNWPDRYEFSSSGTFSLKQNELHLSGIEAHNTVLEPILELTFSDDKQQFSFDDQDKNWWSYVVLAQETEYAKAEPFYEQESYAEDCANRPTNYVCLHYYDDYIWLVAASIREWDDYYSSEHGFVEVAYGGVLYYPHIPVEYHHIPNTNWVKIVRP